jgi:hypothetical protein
MKSIYMYSQFDFQSFVRRRGVMTMIGMMVWVVITLIQLLVQ